MRTTSLAALLFLLIFSVVDSPGMEHHVERGESLSQIVLNYTGSLDALDRVAAINQIKKPDMIRPGLVIRIPDFLVDPPGEFKVPEGFPPSFYKEAGFRAAQNTNYIKAAGYFQKGYDKEPTDAALLNTMLALFYSGRYRALLSLQEREKRETGDILTLSSLAAFALGEQEKGNAFLQRALKKDPSCRRAAAAIRFLETREGP